MARIKIPLLLPLKYRCNINKRKAHVIVHNAQLSVVSRTSKRVIKDVLITDIMKVKRINGTVYYTACLYMRNKDIIQLEFVPTMMNSFIRSLKNEYESALGVELHEAGTRTPRIKSGCLLCGDCTAHVPSSDDTSDTEIPVTSPGRRNHSPGGVMTSATAFRLVSSFNLTKGDMKCHICLGDRAAYSPRRSIDVRGVSFNNNDPAMRMDELISLGVIDMPLDIATQLLVFNGSLSSISSGCGSLLGAFINSNVGDCPISASQETFKDKKATILRALYGHTDALSGPVVSGKSFRVERTESRPYATCNVIPIVRSVSKCEVVLDLEIEDATGYTMGYLPRMYNQVIRFILLHQETSVVEHSGNCRCSTLLAYQYGIRSCMSILQGWNMPLMSMSKFNKVFSYGRLPSPATLFCLYHTEAQYVMSKRNAKDISYFMRPLDMSTYIAQSQSMSDDSEFAIIQRRHRYEKTKETKLLVLIIIVLCYFVFKNWRLF